MSPTTSNGSLPGGTAALWAYDASVPDNATADNFLQRLVLNADVRPRSYWQVARDAQAVSLQVSIVVATVQVFHMLLHNTASTPAILRTVLAAVCAGQTLLWALSGKQLGGNVLRALRQSGLLLVGVYLLSPLYGTLTASVSDDTIAAASTWLMLAHLFMHDYFFVTSVADKLSGSLSLAAAVAASLLLASRLSQPGKVFAQVLFSLTAFIVLPFTCQHVQRASAAAYSFVVLGSATATAALLRRHSWQWAAAYAALHAALVFACPACMLSAHKFKAQINGPWDEAVPKLTSRVREMSHSVGAEPTASGEAA